MEDNYTYPAVIEIHNDYADITFPDFDISTCSESIESEKIIEAAQELLAMTISSMIDCGETLPLPSIVNTINDKELIVYVNIWLPFFRANEKIVYTKKTLTIPVWLDILAKEKNINFSAILVNALKKELNLK